MTEEQKEKIKAQRRGSTNVMAKVVVDTYDKESDDLKDDDLNSSPRKVASIKKQNRKAMPGGFFGEVPSEEKSEPSCFGFNSFTFNKCEDDLSEGSGNSERSVSCGSEPRSTP